MCNRKEVCNNYPIKCEICNATSDLINHYPYFQDKNIVEVVRCKDCKYYSVSRLECHRPYCNGIMGINDFCSKGERKNEN